MKAPFQLLLLVKRHQKKRKVVPETGCWDTLLKTKRRYNSWWPKIKLVCKMTWKRTRIWPFIFLLLTPSGRAKWYCFTRSSFVGVEHWPNVQEKNARCKNKKSSALARCKCDESLCLNKERICFRDFHAAAEIWKFLKRSLHFFK